MNNGSKRVTFVLMPKWVRSFTFYHFYFNPDVLNSVTRNYHYNSKYNGSKCVTLMCKPSGSGQSCSPTLFCPISLNNQ